MRRGKGGNARQQGERFRSGSAPADQADPGELEP